MEIKVSKRVLLACLAALAFSSNAIAITFSNVQLDATAIALTPTGPAGIDSQSSPPSAAPVSASADSVGGPDVATAGAIAGVGLLTASADATGTGISSAVGTAHFAASFLLTNLEPVLVLDFSPLTFATGSGLGTTSLYLTLTSGATTLFSDLITSGTFKRYLGPGSAQLDLVLTSEASAGFPQQGPGNGSAFGLVSVTSAIPLPAPWLLLLVGVAPLAAMKRRVGRALSKAA